jgi:hypothetical protein
MMSVLIYNKPLDRNKDDHLALKDCLKKLEREICKLDESNQPWCSNLNYERYNRPDDIKDEKLDIILDKTLKSITEMQSNVKNSKTRSARSSKSRIFKSKSPSPRSTRSSKSRSSKSRSKGGTRKL